MKRFLLLATLLLVACPGADKDDDDDDGEETGDTDTGGGGDTDSGSGVQGPATWAEFAAAHAEAYCNALETCGFLDEVGFATVQECKDRLNYALGGRECVDYNQENAGLCLEFDVELATSCAAPGEPPVCTQICAPPDSGT